MISSIRTSASGGGLAIRDRWRPARWTWSVSAEPVPSRSGRWSWRRSRPHGCAHLLVATQVADLDPAARDRVLIDLLDAAIAAVSAAQAGAAVEVQVGVAVEGPAQIPQHGSPRGIRRSAPGLGDQRGQLLITGGDVSRPEVGAVIQSVALGCPVPA